MNDRVKDFIEKHADILDNDDISSFLYKAGIELIKKDVDILCSVFSDAGIEFDAHIEDAIKDILKSDRLLKTTSKLRLWLYLDTVPKYNLDHGTFRKLLIECIKDVYPNKSIIVDNFGVEYIVEKV